MLAYFLSKRPWWMADIAQLSIIPAMGAGLWFINEAQLISPLESILPILGAATFWFMAPQLTQAWNPESNDSQPTQNTTQEWIFSLLMWGMLAMALDAHLIPQTQWMWLGGPLAILGHGIAHMTGRKSIGIPAVAFHLLAMVGLVHYLFNPTSEWLTWMPLLGLLIHLSLADLLWPVLNQKTMRRLLSLALFIATALHSTEGLNHIEPTTSILTLAALGVGLSLWAHGRNDRVLAFISAGPALGLACLIALMAYPPDNWERYLPILATIGVHAFLWIKKSDPDPWIKLRALYLATGLIHAWHRFTDSRIPLQPIPRNHSEISPTLKKPNSFTVKTLTHIT